MKAKIIVIGIGQSLRGDDAAGLAAVRLWQTSFPETASRPEVQVETLELPGLSLLDYLNDVSAAVLVDAVHSSSPAGSLHRLSLRRALAFTPESRSAHGWGVAETLELGCTLNPSLTKSRIVLLGIEGETFEMGAPLSPPVEAALPKAARLIQQTVSQLLEKTKTMSHAGNMLQ